MNATALATEAAAGPVLLDALTNLTNRADYVITRLRETVFAPGVEKVVDTRFPISKAAEMVGRTPEAIRQAEAEGRLPPRATRCST